MTGSAMLFEPVVLNALKTFAPLGAGYESLLASAPGKARRMARPPHPANKPPTAL